LLLGRIAGLETTSEHFEPPANFDPARALAGSLGRFRGPASRADGAESGYSKAPTLVLKP
jgi:hypothetical protein